MVAVCFAAVPLEARARRALVVLAGFVGAYLLVAPYTVLDLPGFLNGFGALAAGVPKRIASAEPGWQVYLKHLRNAMGWPGIGLAGGGLVASVIGLVRGPGRARYALVLVFLPVFWSMIIGRALIFGRYLMPAIPFVCLLVGVAVASCAAWLERLKVPKALATGVMVAVVGAALAEPVWTSAGFDRGMGRRGTHALALDWFEANARPGARIIQEAGALRFPRDRYQVVDVERLTDKGLDFYLAGNVDYVVATSAVYGPFLGNPNRFRAEHLAYQDLFRRLTPAFTVEPSDEHPGPEVRIFTNSR